jgi:hypothetical protein
MAVRITDGTDQLLIDAAGRAQVITPITADSAGFVCIASEVDSGAVLGSRQIKELESTEDYRLRVASDIPVFNLSFEGTVVARAHISQTDTTMTAAQASGYFGINSGNATASGNACVVRTYRTFPQFGTFQTYGEFWAREANEDATNAVTEWGFGYATGVATPTDGVFFRRIAGGELRAVMNFGGSETAEAITTPAGYVATACNHYVVSVHQDTCEWWINDVLVRRITVPTSQALPASSSELPIFARVYNSGIASAGRRIEIGYISASVCSAMNTKPWSHVMAGSGGGAYQIQPGTTSGQTTTFSVGSAPAAATFTASTAPATNSLGGLWTSPAAASMPAGSENDYPIFAYVNPAGTATLPGKTLYVTGVRIGETVVTTVLGATYTQLLWGVGCGSTATSLATTDGAATVGPRRIAVGSQVFAATAAVGTAAAGIALDLSDGPMVVPAGTVFHVTLRLIGNTAAAGALRGSVAVIGYYE